MWLKDTGKRGLQYCQGLLEGVLVSHGRCSKINDDVRLALKISFLVLIPSQLVSRLSSSFKSLCKTSPIAAIQAGKTVSIACVTTAGCSSFIEYRVLLLVLKILTQ